MIQWYYKADGEEHGPVSQGELQALAALGQISPDDLVRNDKKPKWYPARAVKGLVVDDEDDVRKVMARLLERNCASVTPVECGEDAIERFAVDPGAFDLALVDLSMPGLGGEEVLHPAVCHARAPQAQLPQFRTGLTERLERLVPEALHEG